MVKGVDVAEFGGPKRPFSGYFIYANEVRAKFMEETKGKDGKIDVGAVGKKTGDSWGKLGDAAQKKYTDQAEKGKAKYEKELAAWKKTKKYEEYVKASEEKKDAKGSGKKRKREEGQPKRPPSAFFCFTNEKRPKVMEETKDKDGKVDIGACGKKLGEMWGKVSDKDKAPYEKQAAAAKAKYEKEMAAFNAKKGKASSESPKKTPEKASAKKASAKKDPAKKVPEKASGKKASGKKASGKK